MKKYSNENQWLDKWEHCKRIKINNNCEWEGKNLSEKLKKNSKSACGRDF